MSKTKTKSMDGFNNSLTQAIQAYIDSGRAEECFSLSCVATALSVKNQRVYATAKTPIPGVAYNPQVYNWDALERFVLRRLEFNETMDDFVARVYGIQEELKNTPKRNPLDKRIHITKADGTEVVYPARRGTAVAVGMTIKLKDDPTEYDVVLVSDTHVVLSNKDTHELYLLSNWNYNAKVDRDSITPPTPVEESSAGVVVEQ